MSCQEGQSSPPAAVEQPGVRDDRLLAILETQAHLQATLNRIASRLETSVLLQQPPLERRDADRHPSVRERLGEELPQVLASVLASLLQTFVFVAVKMFLAYSTSDGDRLVTHSSITLI